MAPRLLPPRSRRDSRRGTRGMGKCTGNKGCCQHRLRSRLRNHPPSRHREYYRAVGLICSSTGLRAVGGGRGWRRRDGEWAPREPSRSASAELDGELAARLFLPEQSRWTRDEPRGRAAERTNAAVGKCVLSRSPGRGEKQRRCEHAPANGWGGAQIVGVSVRGTLADALFNHGYVRVRLPPTAPTTPRDAIRRSRRAFASAFDLTHRHGRRCGDGNRGRDDSVGRGRGHELAALVQHGGFL